MHVYELGLVVLNSLLRISCKRRIRGGNHRVVVKGKRTLTQENVKILNKEIKTLRVAVSLRCDT